MNINEYNKIKDKNYESYCVYLQNKYGLTKRPYFTEKFSKIHTNIRTKEGLIIHHKKEDVAIMLANPSFAKKNPFEYQLPINLVYCDYLEHLLLHVLICEDIIINKKKKRNENEFVGVGGVINFIIPELNDIYSGYKTAQEWRQICHSKIIDDIEVYLEIIKRFIKYFWKPLNLPFEKLNSSYYEQFGEWNKEKNEKINKIIKDIYKKA